MHLDPKYDDYDFPTTAPEAQSGHPGHTTKEQDAQVQQLRMLLEQEGYTDRLDTLTLLRFLRARKFNVQMAHDMYGSTRQHRSRIAADTLPGSQPTRNGEKSLAPTSSSTVSTTRRSHRSSNTTLSTTTRQTRYVAPHHI